MWEILVLIKLALTAWTAVLKDTVYAKKKKKILCTQRMDTHVGTTALKAAGSLTHAQNLYISPTPTPTHTPMEDGALWPHPLSFPHLPCFFQRHHWPRHLAMGRTASYWSDAIGRSHCLSPDGPLRLAEVLPILTVHQAAVREIGLSTRSW